MTNEMPKEIVVWEDAERPYTYKGDARLHIEGTEYTRLAPDDIVISRAELEEHIKAKASDNYDSLKRQFCALKTIANAQSQQLSFYHEQDYKLSKQRLDELSKCLESERDMNAQLTHELLARGK